MARKIKETPILKGKEARAFDLALKANEGKKMPRADFERAQKIFREMKHG